MEKPYAAGLVWFRRDLRPHDNAALYHALRSCRQVHCAFLFDTEEVLTQAGRPYSVFTPYKNAWLAKVDAFYLGSYRVAHHAAALAPRPAADRRAVPTLQEIGFEPSNLAQLPVPVGFRGGAH